MSFSGVQYSSLSVLQPSCCLFVLPIFASMAVVGSFTCGDKSRLTPSHWRRAMFICLIDLAHQILEKGKEEQNKLQQSTTGTAGMLH